jgi:hypothetical protein
LANKESKVARIRLQAIELENSLAKSNKQALDDEANARAQVIQLETNRLRLQKALTAEVTTAIRENNAEQKAIADQKAAEEKEFIKEMIAAEQELLKEEEAAAKAKIDLDKKVKDAKIANAEQVSGAIGQLAAIAGEGTAAGKALGVASATIDTYVGANKAIAQGGFAGIAQAIAIIATGLTNVKTILSTKVPQPNVAGISSGGVGSTPSVPPAPPAFNIVGASDTNQLADAIGGQTQQPVQAYVVANDVTSAQSMDRNIVEGATLG